MGVESFRDGDGTMVPPGIRAPGRGRTAHDYDGGSGSDARSLEAPIVQVTDG
jgi:hypothetical protein